MATLDEIRLQQLLAPFNQTGVMSSSQAVPMINSIPMINTGMIDQRLQNTDLVNQIIEQNKIASMNKFRNTIAPLGNTQQIPLLDNTQQIPLLDNTQQIPLQSLGIDTSYGVANEKDVEQEFLPDQEPSGIAKLFEFLGNIPTPFNLIKRGLESLRGSESLSDFRNSRTGAEFFKKRRDREALARDPNIFQDARDITARLERDGSKDARPDRNRSSVTTSSAAKSRGVGGGGYTKADSARESYRGRY